MTAILIYLFPALMDMILSAVLFMCTVSAAQQGLKASKVSNIITTWAVVYMVVALLLSRVVTPRNARKLIIFSCAMTTALSLLLARTTDINTLYILVALEGVAMACFFVPFQVFMKSVGEGHRKSINYSVGLYTFSWSMGYAAGPFVAGLMWQYVGWRDSHLINAAAALAVGVMTWMIKHKAHPTAVLDEAAPQLLEDQAQASPDYSSMPDLAWMGWVFSGLGCLAIRLVFGAFPSSAASFSLSKPEQGLTLFILSGVQAFVGLWLSGFRWWMYRPGPIFITGLCGVLSLWLFSTARSAPMFYLAATCFGIYSGVFFYYLVFHALVHPARSAGYVAVNEASVGLMSLLGPYLGGRLADAYSLRTAYLSTAAMLIVVVTIQAAIHARYLRARSRGGPIKQLTEPN